MKRLIFNDYSVYKINYPPEGESPCDTCVFYHPIGMFERDCRKPRDFPRLFLLVKHHHSLTYPSIMPRYGKRNLGCLTHVEVYFKKGFHLFQPIYHFKHGKGYWIGNHLYFYHRDTKHITLIHRNHLWD